VAVCPDKGSISIFEILKKNTEQTGAVRSSAFPTAIKPALHYASGRKTGFCICYFCHRADFYSYRSEELALLRLARIVILYTLRNPLILIFDYPDTTFALLFLRRGLVLILSLAFIVGYGGTNVKPSFERCKQDDEAKKCEQGQNKTPILLSYGYSLLSRAGE
jgi:hypothetical protein